MVFHVTTLSPTGTGSIMDALSASNRNIVFDVTGTINLGTQIRTVSGKQNFTLDGGGNITLTIGCLWFENCSNFIIENIRHRGGWSAGQSADNFTNVNSHDFVYANVSVSGSYDEGISSTRGCYNYTLQDCLFGPGGASDHNFGSLNYGHSADWNGPGSFVRNVWVQKDYRNPKLGYRGDSGDGSPNETAPDPNPITYDCVNNITIDCNYGMTAERGAKVRNTNEYTYSQTNATEAITGASIGNFPVPTWAAVTAMSSTDAKNYAKTHAGCLPHDSYDTALVALIP